MRGKTLIFISGLFLTVFMACGHQGSTKNIKEADNRILQQEDGTLSLKLDKAECYSDAVNPSNNTADWNIVISKPCRFKVWLSSATKDTSTLSYSGSVKVNILDDHLEVDPAVDKIIQNSADVPSSYFRADSYVGSFYVPEPGEYNVQVICDKVIAKNSGTQNNSKLDDTKLMSVILTPALR
jgi:hypothetical protein